MEIWNTIQGFRHYQVSNTAKVREIATGKLLKFSNHSAGYLMVYLRGSHGEKGTQCYLHRLVATAFCPNPEDKPEVNHLDGNKANAQWWNLAWSTRVENSEHAIETGLAPSGFKVVDTATGDRYRSIRKAAEACTIPHRTLSRWLSEGGNNRSTFLLVA